MKRLHNRFLAIDFETANYASDSACALGVVRVKDGEIEAQEHFLIRPPDSEFVFTHIHGITWSDVSGSPDFGALWPQLEPYFKEIDFVAAHNIGFDKKVLISCCERYEIGLPNIDYRCTVQMARKKLQINPANLPSVCKHLNIELKHHDAMSDALACAKIAIVAEKMDRPKETFIDFGF